MASPAAPTLDRVWESAGERLGNLPEGRPEPEGAAGVFPLFPGPPAPGGPKARAGPRVEFVKSMPMTYMTYSLRSTYTYQQ
jgi:hypothetical protein